MKTPAPTRRDFLKTTAAASALASPLAAATPAARALCGRRFFPLLVAFGLPAMASLEAELGIPVIDSAATGIDRKSVV